MNNRKLSVSERTILAIEYLNDKRLEVLIDISEQFKSLEGTKILNKNWNLYKKFPLESVTHQFSDNGVHYTFSAWFDVYYNAKLRTRVSISGGSYTDKTYFNSYYSEYDLIGNIDDQLLVDTDLIDKCITDVKGKVKNKMTKAKFDVYQEHYNIAKDTLDEIVNKIPNHFKDIILMCL